MRVVRRLLGLSFIVMAAGCDSCSKPSSPPPPEAPMPSATLAPSASAPPPHARSAARVDSGLSCSEDSWCEIMTVKAGALRGIWGTNTGNLFALWSGVLVHFDGQSWLPVPEKMLDAARFWGVHGSEAGNVWVVGEHGGAFHFDGHWHAAKAPVEADLRAVFARDKDDVWAVGDHATILHWDGAAWSLPTLSREDQPALKATSLWSVWASDPNDAWAVGSGGALLHYDGKGWALRPSGTGAVLHAVWGSGPRDVWAAGDGGTLLHYDGTTWTPSPGGTSARLWAGWAEDANNAWVIGQHGTILHWDGSHWFPSPSGTDDTLYGIWAPLGRDIWIVGASERGKEPGPTSTWRRKTF